MHPQKIFFVRMSSDHTGKMARVSWYTYHADRYLPMDDQMYVAWDQALSPHDPFAGMPPMCLWSSFERTMALAAMN